MLNESPVILKQQSHHCGIETPPLPEEEPEQVEAAIAPLWD